MCCKPKSKIDNTDLNNLLQKAVEAKPEFVEPPPLMPIGRPVLGWNPEKFEYIPPFYQRASFIFSLGLVIGILLGKVL